MPSHLSGNRWAYLGLAIVVVVYAVLIFRHRLPLPVDPGLGLVVLVGFGAVIAVGVALMSFRGPDEREKTRNILGLRFALILFLGAPSAQNRRLRSHCLLCETPCLCVRIEVSPRTRLGKILLRS